MQVLVEVFNLPNVLEVLCSDTLAYGMVCCKYPANMCDTVQLMAYTSSHLEAVMRLDGIDFGLGLGEARVLITKPHYLTCIEQRIAQKNFAQYLRHGERSYVRVTLNRVINEYQDEIGMIYNHDVYVDALARRLVQQAQEQGQSEASVVHNLTYASGVQSLTEMIQKDVSQHVDFAKKVYDSNRNTKSLYDHFFDTGRELVLENLPQYLPSLMNILAAFGPVKPITSDGERDSLRVEYRTQEQATLARKLLPLLLAEVGVQGVTARFYRPPKSLNMHCVQLHGVHVTAPIDKAQAVKDFLQAHMRVKVDAVTFANDGSVVVQLFSVREASNLLKKREMSEADVQKSRDFIKNRRRNEDPDDAYTQRKNMLLARTIYGASFIGQRGAVVTVSPCGGRKPRKNRAFDQGLHFAAAAESQTDCLNQSQYSRITRSNSDSFLEEASDDFSHTKSGAKNDRLNKSGDGNDLIDTGITGSK